MTNQTQTDGDQANNPDPNSNTSAPADQPQGTAEPKSAASTSQAKSQQTTDHVPQLASWLAQRPAEMDRLCKLLNLAPRDQLRSSQGTAIKEGSIVGRQPQPRNSQEYLRRTRRKLSAVFEWVVDNHFYDSGEEVDPTLLKDLHLAAATLGKLRTSRRRPKANYTHKGGWGGKREGAGRKNTKGDDPAQEPTQPKENREI
jgi:hypothetical protein